VIFLFCFFIGDDLVILLINIRYGTVSLDGVSTESIDVQVGWVNFDEKIIENKNTPDIYSFLCKSTMSENYL
jgi:hypothetical protein